MSTLCVEFRNNYNSSRHSLGASYEPGLCLASQMHLAAQFPKANITTAISHMKWGSEQLGDSPKLVSGKPRLTRASVLFLWMTDNRSTRHVHAIPIEHKKSKPDIVFKDREASRPGYGHIFHVHAFLLRSALTEHVIHSLSVNMPGVVGKGQCPTRGDRHTRSPDARLWLNKQPPLGPRAGDIRLSPL